MAYDKLAAEIRRRAPRVKETRITAIDGPSGSGKTNFAASLAQRLDASIIHLEDMYPGWDGLARTPTIAYDHIIKPLQRGDSATLPRWDWAGNSQGATETLRLTGEVILEGVGAAAAQIRPFLSFIIWLEAPEAIRKKRALDRDGDQFAPHWDRWQAQEQALWETDPARDHANVIIDTTEFPSAT